MAQKAKKLLGVDFGMARTGLAHSDDLGIFAVGMGNVKSYNREKAAAEVAAKALEIGAETIVIGKPINMDGTSGEKVALVEEFAALISTHTDIPIEYYDERLSTVSAHRFLSDSHADFSVKVYTFPCKLCFPSRPSASARRFLP